MFVRYGFSVTEHDLDKPWLILDRRHHIVDLPDGQDFFAWATREWPVDRFTVQADPWTFGPEIKALKIACAICGRSSGERSR